MLHYVHESYTLDNVLRTAKFGDEESVWTLEREDWSTALHHLTFEIQPPCEFLLHTGEGPLPFQRRQASPTLAGAQLAPVVFWVPFLGRPSDRKLQETSIIGRFYLVPRKKSPLGRGT